MLWYILWYPFRQISSWRMLWYSADCTQKRVGVWRAPQRIFSNVHLFPFIYSRFLELQLPVYHGLWQYMAVHCSTASTWLVLRRRAIWILPNPEIGYPYMPIMVPISNIRILTPTSLSLVQFAPLSLVQSAPLRAPSMAHGGPSIETGAPTRSSVLKSTELEDAVKLAVCSGIKIVSE